MLRLGMNNRRNAQLELLNGFDSAVFTHGLSEARKEALG